MVKLVCPHERTLIDRLDGRTVSVRVGAARDIVLAAADVRRRNQLACVICDLSVPIEEIEVEDDWLGVPIALMAPMVGRFRNVAKKVGALRRLNLRVYLPCEAVGLVGARMLASLGIPVCIVFEGAPDWDALADLMTYALLGVVPHAPIDPFQTIADGYRQTSRGDDWGRVFFDDPRTYLHLDAEGQIALSRRDLMAGNFVARDLTMLDSPEVKHAIEERCEAWRNLFAEDHFCARCKAWRICRARVRDGKAAPDGCDAFFHEMAEVIEQRRNKPGSNKPAEKWQP
jgi:hypothetical protein